MNVLSGRVIRKDDGMYVQLLGETLALSDEVASRLDDAQDVLIGIRPQLLRLKGKKESAQDIPVTIDVIESLGVEQQVSVKREDAPEITVVRREDSDLKEGDKAYLSFEYHDACIFDRESGETLSFRF